MRIVLSGGGTAGHVIPLLVIAAELKRRGHRVIYIGASQPERKLVKGLKYLQISSGKWRRYFSLQNLIDPFKLIVGCFQAWAMLARLRPDLVLVKGGYVSLPIVFAALMTQTPLYAHESDSVMGIANRLSAWFAKTVFVGFPIEFYPQRLQRKLVFSGTPVRPEVRLKSRARDRKLFGLQAGLKTILVTGGSQGAHAVNELVFSGIKDFLLSYQIIHLTGDYDALRAIELRNRLPFHLQERYKVYKYLDAEFPAALRVADLVITRAGATTLAEVAVARKKAVVIPLPSAASDHQRKNAQYYYKQFGFVVLEQDKTSASDLLRSIKQTLEKKVKIAKLHDATAVIVDRLLENHGN